MNKKEKKVVLKKYFAHRGIQRLVQGQRNAFNEGVLFGVGRRLNEQRGLVLHRVTKRDTSHTRDDILHK